MIKLTEINKNEALRYLGRRKGTRLTEQIENLVDECEKQLLNALEIKYIYKAIDLPCPEIMGGSDIMRHLKGCRRAVLLCATLGSGVDRLIRRLSINEMDKAVVLDALASAAVEQVCDCIDEMIRADFPEFFPTWRFSCGYGDYPIEKQGVFLRILDAPRKIGVCTAQSCMLEPTKSVTAVVGLSDAPPEKRRRGCAGCNMKNICRYRKDGLRCEL